MGAWALLLVGLGVARHVPAVLAVVWLLVLLGGLAARVG